MNDLLREFLSSGMCEASKFYRMPEEVTSAEMTQENIRKRFSDSLDPKDLDLFEEYVRADDIIMSEEVFHAYIGGMRGLVRFASGIFMQQIIHTVINAL